MAHASNHTNLDRNKYEIRVLLLYCTIFYFFPFTIFVAYGNPLEAVMAPRPNYYLGLIFVLFSVAIFWISQRIRFGFKTIINFNIGALFYSKYAMTVGTLSFLLIAIWSRQFLGLEFRHSGTSLSEVGAAGFLLLVFKLYAGVAILVCYRMLFEDKEKAWRVLSLYMITVGFAFSIQSAFDIVFIAVSLAGATYYLRERLGLRHRAIQRIGIIFIPVIAFGGLFVGTANKTGFDAAVILLQDGEYIFNSFVRRISFHFYSTSHHVTSNFFNFSQGLDAISEVTSVIKYRFGVLFGIDGTKPYLGTISRMNFMELAWEPRNRIGASPSMLGSTFFLPGAGLAIIWYVFVIRFVISQTWTIVEGKVASWTAAILTVILVSTVLDAALDAVNPFSSGFIRIILLILGANFVRLSVNQKPAMQT